MPVDTNSPEETEQELETQPQGQKSELWVCVKEEVAGGNPGNLRKGQCFRQLWVFCCCSKNLLKTSYTWTKLQVSPLKWSKESYKQTFVAFNGIHAPLKKTISKATL